MKFLSRDFLKFTAAPLTLLAALFIIYVCFYFLPIPDKEDMIEFMRHYYNQYGYWLVFAAAIGEGLLFVNWYWPGSVAIVFGVVFARPDPLRASVMVLLVMVGFFATTLFNYALGKYGWYRLFLYLGLRKPLEDVKRRVENKGLPIILWSYLHPNLGALTATSAGILQLPFRKFVQYSVIAVLGWNTLWGFVAYFSGPVLLEYMGFTMVLLGLILWFIYLSIKYAQHARSVR